MAIEFNRNAKGQVEARDEERAPGVVGRGKIEARAEQELERLIVQTWHPARVGRVQETLDIVLTGDTVPREAALELQRFFDDSIAFHRQGSEAWASQDRANDREGSSYNNAAGGDPDG
jgi:hypothetical protein